MYASMNDANENWRHHLEKFVFVFHFILILFFYKYVVTNSSLSITISSFSQSTCPNFIDVPLSFHMNLFPNQLPLLLLLLVYFYAIQCQFLHNAYCHSDAATILFVLYHVLLNDLEPGNIPHVC